MSIFRMQQRRGSSANCASCTEAPRDGEIIIEKCNDGSSKMKIGDGIHTFAELSYIDDNKVDKVTGKGLSTNDYTTTEKNKLASIASNANNYSHPTTTAHSATAVKVGNDASGHIVLGSALTASDVGAATASDITTAIQAVSIQVTSDTNGAVVLGMSYGT